MNRVIGKVTMKEPTKYTLITGASSGIGRAIALRLACERNVILHGRDAGRLEETGGSARRRRNGLSGGSTWRILPASRRRLPAC